MALRKVLAACAAFALVGVDASRCRPNSSDAISSSTVIESSTVVASSSATESSTAASSTTVSEQVSSSTTASDEASSSTTQSSEASSSTVESSATSTTSTAPTSTGYLSNPGLDDSGAGWGVTGQGSLYNDPYWYHDAVGVAYLTVTETGKDAGCTISTPLRNLVSGQDYEVSMYWQLNWFDRSDACSYVFYIDDQDFPNTVQSTSGWVKLSTSFTASKSDPELKIQLWCSAIPSNGESDWTPLVSAYVDDVAIAESN